MTFVEPATTDWVDGGGGPIVVNVQVVADSGFGAPASVVYGTGLGGCVDAGSLNGPGPSWTGVWRPLSLVTGTQLLCASALGPDGGLVGFASETIGVDVDGPAFVPAFSRAAADFADPDPNYGVAFARDDGIIGFDPGVGDGIGSGVQTYSCTFELSDGGSFASMNSPYEVDVRGPPMGEHATFIVHCEAADRVGNISSVDAPLPVTRWKWVADVGTGVPLSIPAVSGDGGVFVVAMADAGPLANGIFSFDSRGQPVWAAPVGAAPILPPVLGSRSAESLYVVESSGLVRLIDQVNGSDGGTYSTGDSHIGSLVVNQTSLTADQVVGLATDCKAFSYSSGRVSASYSDTYTAACARWSAGYADGNTAYFGAAANLGTVKFDSIGLLTLSGQQAVENINEDVTAFGGLPAESPVADLAHGYFQSPGCVVTLGASTDTCQAAPMADAEMLLTNAGQIVYPAVDGGILVLQGGNASKTRVDGALGLIDATAHLYAIGDAGAGAVITAFADDGGLPGDGGLGPIEWQFALPYQGSNPPAIACSPSSSGESLLLIPTATGQLVALVVDDRGLNQNAPWPKARHDALNSANTTTPLLSCP